VREVIETQRYLNCADWAQLGYSSRCKGVKYSLDWVNKV